MDKDLRIQKIGEIINTSQAKSSKRIIYKKNPEEVKSYDIPVECLVFNKYNGRIGTFVKTHEKQYGPIDATTDEGEKLIVDFLWKSKETRNKETLSDIKDKGQLEIGIITKDGVIIDGNRRCMLLKKIDEQRNSRPTYFHAAVLGDRLEDNPKEIRKLETIYQMGADQPVDYNAIEKYLKCKELSEKDGFTKEEIAKFMGEKPAKIEEYLKILDLMEEYLKNLGYEEMYTVLSEERLEGPFVNLTSYLETHKTGKRIQGRDWTPVRDDVSDLKNIYFDYIRAGFGTQPPRDIGNPAKGQGFFSHQKLWKEFVVKYSETVEIINDNEKALEVLKQERPDENIDSLIKGRDSDWKNKAKDLLKENLYKTKRDLEDENEANEPLVLLQRAFNSLSAINKNSDSVEGDDIKDISHKIRKLVEGLIKTVEQKDKNK
jgi:hypothetical protein